MQTFLNRLVALFGLRSLSESLQARFLPAGYEDENGFHYGQVPTPSRPPFGEREE